MTNQELINLAEEAREEFINLVNIWGIKDEDVDHFLFAVAYEAPIFANGSIDRKAMFLSTFSDVIREDYFTVPAKECCFDVDRNPSTEDILKRFKHVRKRISRNPGNSFTVYYTTVKGIKNEKPIIESGLIDVCDRWIRYRKTATNPGHATFAF